MATMFVYDGRPIQLPADALPHMRRVAVNLPGVGRVKADIWCSLVNKQAWYLWHGTHNNRPGWFICDDYECVDDCCNP